MVSTSPARRLLATCLALLLSTQGVHAQQNAPVGLIPKAARPIAVDGKLDDWSGAFVTPVHVGHPNFANRGAHVLFLWDDANLYVGLRCLDEKPAHIGTDKQIWNGDAVEFYLDTRGGGKLGAAEFGPGTLHMFWTPFTGTEVKPRLQVRELPAFRDFKLKGAEVAAVKTAWGYTAEFKLPWANFPDFKARAGEIVGIDCELCSSDGGPRVDRTFVYSSPRSVGSPSAFGKVRLVERIEPADLAPLGRALLPLALNQSANYEWLYATVCLSPTIAAAAVNVEGKVLDNKGKVKKTSTGTRRVLPGSGFVLWTGQWELFDLPAGTYALEVTSRDKGGKVITSRRVGFLHGQAAPTPRGQNPSPMVDSTRPHPRLKEALAKGRRAKLEVGALFLPETLKPDKRVPLFIHFHGGTWLPELAASMHGKAAVLSVQLGTGSATYARPFKAPQAFAKLLDSAETRAGLTFAPVGLTAWSAGYGAVREILRVEKNYERVQFVVLIDGLHAGYVGGQPGPRESTLAADDLQAFVKLARDAVAGKKQFLITHSEIFPGTYASTTETADFLLNELGLRRQPLLRWGPMKTQQLSEAGAGAFRVLGFAGNSAPDHIDQLHSLPDYLTWVDWGRGK